MRAMLALICFLSLFDSFAYADTLSVTAEHALSGDEITLHDGRILRLADIKAATPDAKNFLDALVAGHDLTATNPVIDRYGRVASTVYVQGQNQSLQLAMLQAGLAFVYPAVGDVDALLAAENAARAAHAGYWADHPDTAADDAEKLYGHYGFVTGIVVKAERVKNKLYLNFGPDWRTDFTITIAAHDLRAFKDQGLDPLQWQGKNLRVRGWVNHDFGPMITVTDPHQIELLP